jgi:hypothetical protein
MPAAVLDAPSPWPSPRKAPGSGLIGRRKALLDTAAHEIGQASIVFEADVSKKSDRGAAFSAKGGQQFHH